VTDAGEHDLMSVRTIELGAAPGEAAGSEAGE